MEQMLTLTNILIVQQAKEHAIVLHLVADWKLDIFL